MNWKLSSNNSTEMISQVMPQTVRDPLNIIREFQQREPVDVKGIARALGIEVREEVLGDGISGKITRNDGCYTITVDASESKLRQRFTIAHEIAHYVLHADLIENGVIDNEMYRSKQLSDERERQANRFAAWILMPDNLVRSLADQHLDAKQIAERLQVSEAAMKVRLEILAQESTV